MLIGCRCELRRSKRDVDNPVVSRWVVGKTVKNSVQNGWACGQLFADAEAGEYFAQQFIAGHSAGNFPQMIVDLAQILGQ